GAISLPTSFDWRNSRAVSPVGNRGLLCASDWAFAAVGSLESSYYIKYNTMPDLSVQQLLDCSTAYGNTACLGGTANNAFKYIKEQDGLATARSYPYSGVSTGLICLASTKPKVARVDSYARITAGNEQDLLGIMVNKGPVAVAINTNNEQFINYQGGILDVPNCGNTPAEWFLVVGYGTDNGVDYWTLQSSRGAGWGEKVHGRFEPGKLRLVARHSNHSATVLYPNLLPYFDSNEEY
ncbi:unnamed protein product, partial [Medioppia subpectinata]